MHYCELMANVLACIDTLAWPAYRIESFTLSLRYSVNMCSKSFGGSDYLLDEAQK